MTIKLEVVFIRVLPLEQSKSSIKVVFVPEIKKPNPFLWAISYLGKTFSCVVALNNFFKAALFFFADYSRSELPDLKSPMLFSSITEPCLL